MLSFRRGPLLAALLLLVFAVLIRSPDFGNPVIEIDEQFYALMGQRMVTDGALPYVDIWDRKPIGIFLPFALGRLLGEGVLPYQLIATAFAWLTAIGVSGCVRRIGGRPVTALASALLYLLWIELFGGRGGQAAVFFNLFMVWAMWLVLALPALAADHRRGAIVASGLLACLLAGCAIQMKYTPVIEGAFFGLAHIAFLRRAGAAWSQLTIAALGWMLAGAAPTLVPMGWYAAIGHLDAFLYANVWSIFDRNGNPPLTTASKLLGIVAKTSPLWVAVIFALRGWDRPGRVLLIGWIVAAVIGFLSIGTFYLSYALSLIPPFVIAAAPLLDRKPAWAAPLFLFAAGLWVRDTYFFWDDRHNIAAVARVMAAQSGKGCPYIFEGDPILYQIAGTCLPGPYIFPSHLWSTVETGAIGRDQLGEVRRILDARPPVIVVATAPKDVWNRQVLALVRVRLARNYRVIARIPRQDYALMVFGRADARRPESGPQAVSRSILP